jgi:hypothetical protein
LLATSKQDGVAVKVIWSDNDLVTGRVCAQVGIDPGQIITGEDLDRMNRSGAGPHFFRASEAEFRTGWFVESLATRTLVLFPIPCDVWLTRPALLRPETCRQLGSNFTVAKCFRFRQAPHIGHKIVQQDGMIVFPPDKDERERKVQIRDRKQ